MDLPGGLWQSNERRRDFAFKPITGTVELAVAESLEDESPLPVRVTGVLAQALDRLGGEIPTPGMIRELAVGDRQYLMRRLAVLLGIDRMWLNAYCRGCAAPFDVSVQNSLLPVKQADEGFPYVQVETSLGVCRFRVPLGSDQEFVAGLAADQEALRTLLGRCLVTVDGASVAADAGLISRLQDAEIGRIEAAMERVAPEVTTSAETRCPECGALNVVQIDPYVCLSHGLGDIYAQVHVLAIHYHWSEADILGLPRGRRQVYLDLIDRARGMTH